MEACDSCSERVAIGNGYKNASVPRKAIGMVLVYLPILTLPFVFLSAYLTYFHLKMMGAKDLKTLRHYLPSRDSHRYNLKNQITMVPSFKASTSQYKLFWVLNCTWYCPVSVALFEWHTYLVKLVENWWCPFTHERKEDYKDAAIDQSFWHLEAKDKAKLTKEDRDNPIWNEAAAKKASKKATTAKKK